MKATDCKNNLIIFTWLIEGEDSYLLCLQRPLKQVQKRKVYTLKEKLTLTDYKRLLIYLIWRIMTFDHTRSYFFVEVHLEDPNKRPWSQCLIRSIMYIPTPFFLWFFCNFTYKKHLNFLFGYAPCTLTTAPVNDSLH